MPVVKTLDSASLYAYCGTCAQQGNPNSPLRRELDTVQCPLGHKFQGSMAMTASGGALPDTANMSMVKLTEYQPEQPQITDVAWKIFTHPSIRAKLEERYAGRVMATVSTYLMALADGSVVMITGPDAVKLKSMGIKNGAEILATVDSVRQLEKDLADANARLEQFQKILVAAGVS
jgi:hypothetical protein